MDNMEKQMKDYIDRGKYWDRLTDQERIASYNGMGAEWMSKTSREILDWLFSILEDAVRIHDVDYCYSRKSKKAWHEDNQRMYDNMIKIAKNEIPWWRWFKKRRFIKLWIPILFDCVESKGGWKAFKEASPPHIH